MLVNTPTGKTSQHDDSYIRKAAIKHNVPYITTLRPPLAAAEGIAASRGGRGKVKSLQAYHASLNGPAVPPVVKHDSQEVNA